MPTMSLDKEIKKYLPHLDIEEKQSLLSVIKSFLKLKEAPAQTPCISLEEYNKEGHEALERVKNGQFYSHEEVEEIAESW